MFTLTRIIEGRNHSVRISLLYDCRYYTVTPELFSTKLERLWTRSSSAWTAKCLQADSFRILFSNISTELYTGWVVLLSCCQNFYSRRLWHRVGYSRDSHNIILQMSPLPLPFSSLLSEITMYLHIRLSRGDIHLPKFSSVKNERS